MPISRTGRRSTPRASRTILIRRPGRRSPQPGLFGRGRPSKTKGNQALSALMAAGKGARTQSSGGKRKSASGLALLAGAVGLAVRHRKRLTGLVPGQRPESPDDATVAQSLAGDRPPPAADGLAAGVPLP